MSIVNNPVHLCLTGSLSLGEARYLDFASAVLLNLAVLFIVEQVYNLATVNFEEAHVKFDSCRRQLVHVSDSVLSHSRHCVSLTRACLTIGEQGHDSSFEQTWQQVLDLVLVDRIGVLLFRVSIVKVEIVVLNILGYAVDFVLWIVNRNLRVRHRHDVDLAVGCLLLEEWALTHTDADLHL